MNDKQLKLVNDYSEKYGGVEVREVGEMVQLLLDANMVGMEGIPFSWLERFSKEFYEISVGPSRIKGYSMYITLFKKDPFDWHSIDIE